MTPDPPDIEPRIRRAPIPPDARVIVRGVDEDDPAASIRQAQLFRARYAAWGRGGLSGFLARSDEEVLDLGADRPAQFPSYGPSTSRYSTQADSRSPDVSQPARTIAFDDAPEVAVARLLGLPHRMVANPAYREES